MSIINGAGDPLQLTASEELLTAFSRLAGRISDMTRAEPSARELETMLVRLAEESPHLQQRDVEFLHLLMVDYFGGFRVFRETEHIRKATFFGSARTPPDHPDYVMANQTARVFARHGWGVIEGEGPGIMDAARLGADPNNLYGIKINLTWEPPKPDRIGNPRFSEFQSFAPRKFMLIRPASAFIVFPGGFGTMDELFEVLTLIQTGHESPVPVELVSSPGTSSMWDAVDDLVKSMADYPTISRGDESLYHRSQSVGEAFKSVTDFYRNYHSHEWQDDRLIIRVNAPVTMADLETLNNRFGDVLKSGRITRISAKGAREQHMTHLDRIALVPDPHKLRMVRPVIDAVNALPSIELAHQHLGIAGDPGRVAALTARKDWPTALMNGEATSLYAAEQAAAVPLPAGARLLQMSSLSA